MRTAYLTIRNEHEEQTWDEIYRENDGTVRGLTSSIIDVERWARDVIAYWNSTLRPQDSARVLVAVRVEETADVEPVKLEHDWHKTNLVTVESRGQYFDRMECTRCGITGKRYGFSYIKRDAAFKAKKYERCVE